MSESLISIVLPTYNGARFLRASVQSCIDQLWQHWELIIVNDCSTDETLSIAMEYAARDSRIRVVTNTTNLKLPRSLNRGFEEAKGAFFTWTSDDNFYAPEALKLMAETLLQHPECDLVYADDTFINDEDEIVGHWGINDVNVAGVAKWTGAGACFLYRRELHDRLGGYDPGAFLIEDYDFFLRGFLDGTYLFIPKADLYFYRHHGGSLTHRYHRYVNDMHKLLHEKYIEKIAAKTTKADLALLYRKQAVYHALQKHDLNKSGKYLGKLAVASKRQWLITLAYIASKGLLQGLQSIVFVVAQFFRNLFAA